MNQHRYLPLTHELLKLIQRLGRYEEENSEELYWLVLLFIQNLISIQSKNKINLRRRTRFGECLVLLIRLNILVTAFNT